MSLTNLKPWKAGQSGNPSGRSKDVADLMRLAQKKCSKAINVCAEILEDESVRVVVRLDAAKILLDRGMGKPVQPIALAESTRPPIMTSDFTEAELVEMETRARGALAKHEEETRARDPSCPLNPGPASQRSRTRSQGLPRSRPTPAFFSASCR